MTIIFRERVHNTQQQRRQQERRASRSSAASNEARARDRWLELAGYNHTIIMMMALDAAKLKKNTLSLSSTVRLPTWC